MIDSLLLQENAASRRMTAFVFALVLFVLLWLLKTVFRRFFVAMAKRTENELDDLAADLIKRLKTPILLAAALYAGSRFLVLTPKIKTVLNTMAALLLLLQTALLAHGLIDYYISRRKRRKLEEDADSVTTLTALSFLLKVALWSIVVVLALDNLGIDITALITGLGIGGVAVALALQHILSDLFASLSIVLDKPFVIGDFITVDTFMGHVEHIGLKTTRVRSVSGEQMIFSNSDLLSSRIRNFKRMQERRILFNIGVVYQTPAEKLEMIPQLISDIIAGIEHARLDRIHFARFGDFSLIFEVVYWVTVPEYRTAMDIQQQINLAIYRKFGELGIQFAYPTQTVFVEKSA